MPAIKYGQYGVGHAHASKISVYRESPDFDVVGVVEPDPELRRRAAGQAAYQGLRFMTEEELLNVPGLQVVGVEIAEHKGPAVAVEHRAGVATAVDADRNLLGDNSIADVDAGRVDTCRTVAAARVQTVTHRGQ